MPGWITIRDRCQCPVCIHGVAYRTKITSCRTLRPRDQPPLQRRHLFKFDGGADHFDEHSPWKWTEINVMGQLLKSFAMAVSFRTPQLNAQLTSVSASRRARLP
ncbi:hypothetical protein WJX79_009635 [Trebouxia sp. C0005]